MSRITFSLRRLASHIMIGTLLFQNIAQSTLWAVGEIRYGTDTTTLEIGSAPFEKYGHVWHLNDNEELTVAPLAGAEALSTPLHIKNSGTVSLQGMQSTTSIEVEAPKLKCQGVQAKSLKADKILNEGRLIIEILEARSLENCGDISALFVNTRLKVQEMENKASIGGTDGGQSSFIIHN